MPYSTSPALRPYRGAFGVDEGRYLLRRATIGACTQANVERAVDLGLAGTLAQLTEPSDIGVPVTIVDDHPRLRLGEPWLGVPHGEGDVDRWRDRSVYEWHLAGMLEGGFSLRGRMWLFWLNHFGVQTENPPQLCYEYLRLLYDRGVGDFARLVKDVTVEGAMLRFLNGENNAAAAPNENFARELLELFTVGKGPQRGAGDYTYYTEDDVREFARALTGWRTRNTFFTDPDTAPGSYFDPERHDTGDKRFSEAFGNAVIGDGGEREYERVVDLILGQPRSLDYVCRKLYRWFVDYRVDERVEAEIVRPLAEVLRVTGFDIGATVQTLLQSEHFFDASHRGAVAKSPLDFVADVTVGFGGELPSKGEVTRRSEAVMQLYHRIHDQDMLLYRPHSVAGYVPFHQAPNYNRLWVNPTALLQRSKLVNRLRGYGIGLGEAGVYRVDVLAYVDELTNPYDPNDLLAELAERHLCVAIPYDQVTTLKEFLIPDLPDWEWTIEYGLYRAKPADSAQRKAVADRVEAAWAALCTSAEFMLS